jgi:hypothetical protein
MQENLITFVLEAPSTEKQLCPACSWPLLLLGDTATMFCRRAWQLFYALRFPQNVIYDYWPPPPAGYQYEEDSEDDDGDEQG